MNVRKILYVRCGLYAGCVFSHVCARVCEQQTEMRHHWVHRRQLEGRCAHCGKALNQKFPFSGASKVRRDSTQYCRTHNTVH